jgi:MFS family permease
MGRRSDITGPLSDPCGRKGLIVAGIWIQALALFMTGMTGRFAWWLVASMLLGAGNSHGLSKPYRSGFRRFAPELARSVLERLSLPARPWLCDGGTLRRPHCG